MPSFDTVLEANFVEVKNAVENAAKEIATRFDFKGTSAAVELKDKEITIFGDAEFQLTQVEDLLRNKLTKRNVDVRFLDIQKSQKIEMFSKSLLICAIIPRTLNPSSVRSNSSCVTR